jgi:hypothetical protein
MKERTLASIDPVMNTIIINNHMVQGFPDGAKIKIVMKNDDWTYSGGTDGYGTRIKNNDNSAEITVRTKSTSPSNDILMSFRNIDVTIKGGKPYPILFKDCFGTTTAKAATAWLKKIPEFGSGKDIEDRDWVYETNNLEVFVGSNIQFGV